jgi:hypothetical protein
MVQVVHAKVWCFCFPSELLVSFKLLYIGELVSQCAIKKGGREMFDLAMLVLVAAASSSLLVAVVEYVYSRRRRLRAEAV